MDSPNFLALARLPSAAPALTRGMAVLALLAGKAPLPLDEIVRALNLPRASVFRLLESLQEAGMVRKTDGKKYEPMWVLQPVVNAAAQYRERIRGCLTVLSSKTECTAEWYEPSANGLKLVLQQHSEGELQVRARPGMVRDWGAELDAVARLGYAFDPTAPALAKSLRGHVCNGQLSPLPLRDAREAIQKAQESGHARDVFYNGNGVRRFAAAALEEQTFRGVLALAESFHFRRKKVEADYYLQRVIQALPKK